ILSILLTKRTPRGWRASRTRPREWLAGLSTVTRVRRMKRHWSARLLSASLALWFGLATFGPQAHQCPLHDAPVTAAAGHAAGPASPDAPKGHQPRSCPQACCPAGALAALPGVAVRWTPAPAPVVVTVVARPRVVLPRAPRYLL